MDAEYYQCERREVYDIVSASAKRVLEVGCAAGGFRLNFPEQVEYWGIEPVREVAELAKSRGVKVLCGTYDAVCNQVPSGYSDLVVCYEVIEHVLTPASLLLSLKEKLTSDGILIGSIPNVRFWGNLIKLLINRDWKYERSGVLDETHLRFLTAKSFRRLMKNTGYRLLILRGLESRRMKVLKVLFAPLLLFLGFDVCDMQIMFKASKI